MSKRTIYRFTIAAFLAVTMLTIGTVCWYAYDNRDGYRNLKVARNIQPPISEAKLRSLFYGHITEFLEDDYKVLYFDTPSLQAERIRACINMDGEVTRLQWDEGKDGSWTTRSYADGVKCY